jgi:hypothetical protein
MKKKTFKEILDSTEVADMIAVESLKWHFNYFSARNLELFEMKPLKPHHREEIIDNEKHRDALRLILNMFGENV